MPNIISEFGYEERSVCLLHRLAEGIWLENWTKLMLIIKRTGITWHERRLISKFYIDQSVKLRMGQEDTRNVRIGRGVRQGCCLSPNLFNLYSEYLTKEALENLEDFKSGGQEIRTVKYANEFVLLGKKETMLQGTTGRFIELIRYY